MLRRFPELDDVAPALLVEALEGGVIMLLLAWEEGAVRIMSLSSLVSAGFHGHKPIYPLGRKCGSVAVRIGKR
jgi:hypothetical protein